MSKIIAFDKEAKKKILAGIAILAKSVKVTLGPKGKNVIVREKDGRVFRAKDGASIADRVHVKDHLEEIGIDIIRESGIKTGERVGDGRTTSLVLCEAIVREGMKRILGGHDPMQVKKGLDAALPVLIEALSQMAKSIKTDDDLLQIAMLSANQDKETSEIVANLFKKVGKEGKIRVEKGESKETKVKFSEGLSFDKGYISPYFVTNPENMQCELEDPYVFITDKKLQVMFDVVPILEKVVENKSNALLIVADDVVDEALTTIVVNCLKGGIKLAAVKAPSFGDRKQDLLKDIALLTGGEVAHTIKDLDIRLFGKAKRVYIDRESTTIVGGYGDKKFENSVATIQVGAFTEPEANEKRDRTQEAVAAVRASLKEGVVPGGGVAYLRALAKLQTLTLAGDANLAKGILREALSEPFKTIAENGGISGTIALARVLAGKDDFGCNVLTGDFEPLIKAGIIDPLLVVKEALINAISTGGMLLTVEAMVAKKKQ